MAENILEDALRATGGDRPSQYGHPLDHFSMTVALFNARFAAKLKEPLTPEEWPIAMTLDKIARHAHCGQRDSLVDMAGYPRTVEMLQQERARRVSVHAPAPSNGNGQAHGVDTRGLVPGNGLQAHALEACPEAQGDGHPG